jgi:hypothetical protein
MTFRPLLPRAFVPPRVRYERDPKVALDAMAKAGDFARVAWVRAPAEPPREVANGPGTLHIRRDGTAFEIDARMADGGLGRDLRVGLARLAGRGRRPPVFALRRLAARPA